jgi:predicted ATPase
MVYGGWIKAMEGRPEEGIPELEEGFEQWICKHGGRVTHSLYCVMMAEALQCAGLWEKGLSIVENGLAVIRQCHEHCYEPELHRLKGELLCEFADGRKGEAEDAFEIALQTSRAQGEKILELRGAVSLARFWQESGRKAEALALLNGVCQGFSEGLDIPDLLGAKALIESLGAGVEQPG